MDDHPSARRRRRTPRARPTADAPAVDLAAGDPAAPPETLPGAGDPAGHGGEAGGMHPHPPGRPSRESAAEQSAARRTRTEPGQPIQDVPGDGGADSGAEGRSGAQPTDRTSSPRSPVDGGPRNRRERSEESADRFLRALVTHRGTQVSSEAAMRAREVAAPTPQDMADAERDVVIKRRYYTPTEQLPTGRNRGRSGPRG